MSFRHALLGLIAERLASGYDLLKIFDQSLAFVWPATQSQLYGPAQGLLDHCRRSRRARALAHRGGTGQTPPQ
jgi:hypothetical protein